MRDTLTPREMQTYGIDRKKNRRRATCAEVDCEAWMKGWSTVVEVADPLRSQKLAYWRHQWRQATETVLPDGIRFTIPPGVGCPQTHYTHDDRPALFVVRRGDRRRYLETLRTHTRPEHWVEDFAEHQDRIATVLTNR